jgi:hypothetical protein
MKRKEAVYKGLEYIDVYYTDTSATSPDYFQISEFPLRLTAGKNLFKLRGHPTNLKVGGILNIEVLDYNGDPIYTEVVDYIDEDKSRVIAIYVYSDTSPGDCTVTIIGEASILQGGVAPTEWQGRPNVKWTRSIPVNPNISNVSEIIFEQSPVVTVDELIGVQLDRTYSGSTQFPTYSTGTVRYYSYNNQPAIELLGGKFTSDMSTGTITVATPVNPTPTPNFTISTTPYVGTIKKILTPTTALLDTEYTAYSSQSISIHTFNAFDYSAYSLSYEATPTYIETENSQSFAYIQISGLEPATGDVSRIKVFSNNNGTVGTWELINDIELDETEIFVPSTSSLYPDKSIGVFSTQSVIDTYWTSSALQGTAVLPLPILGWSTASLDSAMKISSSMNLSADNAVLVAQIKPEYAGVFIESSSYKITLDALGTRTGSLDPVLSVYLSGSAFYQDPTDYFNQTFTNKFGKRIGEIRVTGDNQRFDDYVFNFESDYTGTGVLLLVVESGIWQVADIHATSDNDAGYSPNYTRIKSFVTTTHKINNQISFKVEYYNVNGERSKQISYVYNKDWEGGNRYIDGNFSMLTGSLYVADSLNSGVAISGYPNSGFIRSLGYEGFDAGFPGFLLWSGSAMPGQTSKGLPYSGVGLELYANTSSYFRYSTSTNEIDVRTDKFFFGNPSSSYISGSNGILSISASNFVLSPEGNVTASNALFTGVALANIIRDKTVTITAANSGSYLQTYDIQPGAGTTFGTRIVMDGTLGGEIIRRVRLSVVPPYPIADFKLPALSSTAKLDITLEMGVDAEIYDIFIVGKTGGETGYPPPVVLLSTNAVITFVAGGTTGATWLTSAGTEHPFDHIFKNDVFITGSNGVLIIQRSNTSDPYIRLVTTGSQWAMGTDQSDNNSFNITNSTSLQTGTNLALKIDTDENIWIPGNVTITGSFALGGIANTVTANSLYYDTTTKQVTYGAAGGGGGGTPGGSDTQIQYNNAGTFGGVSALTWNGTTLRATGSFTGSLRGNLIGSASFATTASYALNGGGSGTVNTGTANYLAYYDSTAASISDIYQFGAGVKTNAIEYDGFQWGWGLMLVTSAGVTGSQISPGVNGQDSWLNASGGTVGIGKNSSFAQGKLDVLGNSTITGSLTVTQGVTGSLLGIASSGSTILIQNTPATTGTYYPVFVSNISGYGQARIDNSTYTYNPTTNTLTVTASYAETSSFINPLNQNATLSGSLQITGSLTISGSSTFINIGPAQFTGSVSSLNGYTGSLQGTASFATSASIAGTALVANSTNLAISSSYASTALSSSYALTASFVSNALTPSGGEGAVQFANGSGIAGNSRFTYDTANNIVNITNGGTLNATGSLLGTASVAMSAATTRIATSGIYYPVFVDSANGAAAAETLWTSTGNISINPASGSITATSFTGSLRGTVATSSFVINTVTGTNSADLVYGNMADNDQFRIRIGGTATNAGFVEIATADDGTEPIHVRQYSGVFSSLVRTATLLDGSGNTSFPGSVTATSVTASITGSVNGAVINNTAWVSYTPEWTAASVNPVIGNGTMTGQYKVIGKTCFVRGNIVMGSTTTFGTGEWYVSMPFTASNADAILMTVNLLDQGSAWYNAVLNGARAGFNYKTAIQYQAVGGTANDVNATQPFTWATSDRFIWNGSYEIA